MQDNFEEKITEYWNKLYIDKNIQVCAGKLKDIGVLDLKIMKLIYFNPDFRIKDYLKVLKIPNSSLTNVINRLVKKELIIRNLSDNDLRSFSLKLTQEGRQGVEEHLAAEKALFAQLFNSFSEDEKNEFIRLLSKIVE